MPEKKTIKIGVAVLAAVALVIGLSVGLTQNSKNTTNAMSASQGTEVGGFNFETDCPEVLSPGSKGSKVSGFGSGKSDKSVDKQTSTISGKSSGRRLGHLERDLQEPSSGKSEKGLSTSSVEAGKSVKGVSVEAGKSGKSGSPSPVETFCADACVEYTCTETYYANGSKGSKGSGSKISGSGSKSGKSGSADGAIESDPTQSGKSEKDSSMQGSGTKSGKSESSTESVCAEFNGKSSKGSSSAAENGSKGSKSNAVFEELCPIPTEFDTPSPTPAPVVTPVETVPTSPAPSPDPTTGSTPTVAAEATSYGGEQEGRTPTL